MESSFLFSYLWQFWFAGPVFKIFNRAFVLEHEKEQTDNLKSRVANAVTPTAVHVGYRTLSTEEIGQYLITMPFLLTRLGFGDADIYSAGGDGNVIHCL